MVPAVCSWHERHADAPAEMTGLARGEQLCCAAHALVEAYAVLTRLPLPHRLSAADAWMVIKANFVDGATVVTLAAGRYADLLERAARLQIAGGRTDDVIIGECAREAKADVLLTFIRRHFDPPPIGVTVVEPAR